MEIRYPNGRVRIELDVFFPSRTDKNEKIEIIDPDKR